jgi:DNA repair exonuclease SbcCD ATPase subunit
MILKKVRGKNFFSIGNDFLEIDLLKHKQAVMIGKNGNGKSTIFSLITFVLFGKTIKPVTKALIINSINGKNCVGEIELSCNGKEYLIRRGIKPNIFEIYEDGDLIDQSAVLDYQAFLEENILKCSYRTFLQTTIITIENYRPFMSLPAKERRDFIEDILDIGVFSSMNVLVKAKVTKTKEELKLLDVSMKSLKEKIILQKSHIATLEDMTATGLETLNNRLSEYHKERITNTRIITESAIEQAKLEARNKELRQDKKFLDELNLQLRDVKSKIATAEKQISFFDINTECPSCHQGIDHKHVSSIRAAHDTVYAALVQEKEYVISQLPLYADVDTKIAAYQKDLNTYNTVVGVANANISRINKSIAGVESDIVNMSESVNIQDQKMSLAEYIKDVLALRDRQTELNEEQDYNSIMLELFKDTGIKSKIVEQYLPVINLLVNQYLDKLDFFVSFNLNSEFTEIIKSRHRDDFTYSSFSAGEKIRIDIALMFTFRQLAKMRNSFSCNILCLDELFDGSVDSDGIELLLNIFDSEEFNSTNLMVISHGNKDRFEERFDGSYEFAKRDGFTIIKE